MHWIYLLGERNGEDIKIGKTSARRVAQRMKQVDAEQTTNATYLCLAAVIATPAEERKLQRHFGHLLREDKGRKREYFHPASELVEYAAWLRSQYFASADGEDDREGWAHIEPDVWLPDGEARRMSRPNDDPDRLVQDYESIPSTLSGTPWSWFPNPRASIQDYFTPLELIDAIREGMGGIDLDAASHWLANRTLKIPRYFHRSYSAFDHDWEGRVWLNPPFGDNAPWWERALKFIRSGQVEQLCIVSPVWAFTTGIAKPLMREVRATVLLTPTPKWWGNPAGKVGSDHPHAIVYIGDRVSQVLAALEPWGIPLKIAWEEIDEFRPIEDDQRENERNRGTP